MNAEELVFAISFQWCAMYSLRNAPLPQGDYFFTCYWNEFVTGWNNFIFDVEVRTVLLTTHK